MAKRFFTTELFDDEWFFELSQDEKIFWIYYLTKCDHAGLLKNNKKLIEFQCGFKDLDTVLVAFHNRIIRVTDTLFFCPKFITFQYPGFETTTFKAALSAKEILIKIGIDPDNYLEVKGELPNSPIKSNIISEGKIKSSSNGTDKIKSEQKNKNFEFPEYQECLAAYFEFYEKLNGVKPNVKAQDFAALKKLILHFRPMAKEGNTVLDGFKYIFNNWNLLDDFTQKQIDISKIYSNINSIITQFKKPKKNGHTTSKDYDENFTKRMFDKIDELYRKE